MHFICLSSSRGTVLESVLKAMKRGELQAECLGLVTDQSERGCAAVALRHGVPLIVTEREPSEDRVHYDRRLHAAIQSLIPPDIDPSSVMITTLGWMWLLSPEFVSKYPSRIINVHPSLLPKHPGAHAHDLVLLSKDKESGMTIHLIDEGMDTGRILLQKKCPVLPGDTTETLKARVQELEKEWFPRMMQMIVDGKLKIDD